MHLYRFQDDDIIYFWTYALRNGLGYRQDNGKFEVSKDRNVEESNMSARTCSTSDPAFQFEIPNAELKVFSPSGFEVSIPGMHFYHFVD